MEGSEFHGDYFIVFIAFSIMKINDRCRFKYMLFRISLQIVLPLTRFLPVYLNQKRVDYTSARDDMKPNTHCS